mmetsp:Transcript_12617/g.37472  ORF Transcript_12617/g.37472 Transcript_12617/m.37472 type:complete len:233 (-) Transcript_12617:293-991(-)
MRRAGPGQPTRLFRSRGSPSAVSKIHMRSALSRPLVSSTGCPGMKEAVTTGPWCAASTEWWATRLSRSQTTRAPLEAPLMRWAGAAGPVLNASAVMRPCTCSNSMSTRSSRALTRQMRPLAKPTATTSRMLGASRRQLTALSALVACDEKACIRLCVRTFQRLRPPFEPPSRTLWRYVGGWHTAVHSPKSGASFSFPRGPSTLAVCFSVPVGGAPTSDSCQTNTSAPELETR